MFEKMWKTSIWIIYIHRQFAFHKSKLNIDKNKKSLMKSNINAFRKDLAINVTLS